MCKSVRSMEQMHRVREILPNIFEHGLYCDNCESFVHSHFLTKDLEQDQTELNKLAEMYRQNRLRSTFRELKKRQRRYKQKFDKVQKNIRKQLGMPEEGKVVWKKDLNMQQEKSD